MEPTLLTKPELKLIGIEARTINRDEMAPSTARIPGLWRRFFEERIAETIPNRRLPSPAIAAYTKYESDHTGAYSLIIGVEVSTLESIPSSMTGLTIPAGRYLVVRAQGDMPKALIDTWMYIWNYFSKGTRHTRLYTTDYEVHRSSDTVDIHIAVQ
jgi:predicted transcriptional regulator YdeE